MNAIMNTTNRFWQECQRFDRAQNKHEIKTDRWPQALGVGVA